MVEKLTFNSWATALVDIPAVSMPIAHSLKTCDICGIVLCDQIYIYFKYKGRYTLMATIIISIIVF